MKTILIIILIFGYNVCYSQSTKNESIIFKINKTSEINIYSYNIVVLENSVLLSIYFNFNSTINLDNKSIVKCKPLLDINNLLPLTPDYVTIESEKLDSTDKLYGIFVYFLNEKAKRNYFLKDSNQTKVNLNSHADLQIIDTEASSFANLETKLVLANKSYEKGLNKGFDEIDSLLETFKSKEYILKTLYPYWEYLFYQTLNNNFKKDENAIAEYAKEYAEHGGENTSILTSRLNYLSYLEAKKLADDFYDSDNYGEGLTKYKDIELKNLNNYSKFFSQNTKDYISFRKLFCDYYINFESNFDVNVKNNDLTLTYIQKFEAFKSSNMKYRALLILGNLNFYIKEYFTARKYYDEIIESKDDNLDQLKKIAQECKNNIP
ncbi:hypothetical protein BH10BAC5_BH10BAC5_25490 [soil metagenome]